MIVFVGDRVTNTERQNEDDWDSDAAGSVHRVTRQPISFQSQRFWRIWGASGRSSSFTDATESFRSTLTLHQSNRQKQQHGRSRSTGIDTSHLHRQVALFVCVPGRKHWTCAPPCGCETLQGLTRCLCKSSQFEFKLFNSMDTVKNVFAIGSQAAAVSLAVCAHY